MSPAATTVAKHLSTQALSLIVTPAQARKLLILKAIPASIVFTPTEVLTSKRLRTLASSITLTPAESFVSKYVRTLAVTNTLTAALVKQATHLSAVAATLSFTLTSAQVKKFTKILNYTLVATLNMLDLAAGHTNLNLSFTLTAGWQRLIGHSFPGSLTLAVAQGRVLTAFRTLGASAGLTGALTDSATHSRGLNTTTLLSPVSVWKFITTFNRTLPMLLSLQTSGNAQVPLAVAVQFNIVRQIRVNHFAATAFSITPQLGSQAFAHKTLAAGIVWFNSLGAFTSDFRKLNGGINLTPFMLNTPTLFSRRPVQYTKLSSAKINRAVLVRAKAR
jgi:hypothetical protein